MANKKHLKILEQGVEVWNQWREDNPEVKPDFNGLYLIAASFSGVDFIEADLREAVLNGTDFFAAKFREADLSGADLSGANLSRTDLSNADFQNVNLQTARLINTKLDGANLTGARLWETQRAGWSIKGVICESVYWDKEGEKKSIYAEGEFEKLFADLAKIQLSYKDGISFLEIATLPSLIQHLVNTFPDSSLRFVNMRTDSGGAVVELAIEDIDDLSKEQIKQLQVALEKEAQQQVESQRKALEEREKRLELEGEIRQLNAFVDKLLLRQGNTIHISNSQIAAVGHNAHTQNSNFNQIVNAGKTDIKTQVQGERNVVIDGDANDSNIITGNKNSIENE